MTLCKYKNMFGEVGTGAHSYRVFNIAIVDVAVTIIIALLIKLLFPNVSLIIVLLSLFIAGIIAHRLFCVETTVDKFLFKK